MSFTSSVTLGGMIPNGGSTTKLFKINERQRQGLINLGEQQINAVYGGGTAPFYQLAQYNKPLRPASATGFYTSPLTGQRAGTNPSFGPDPMTPRTPGLNAVDPRTPRTGVTAGTPPSAAPIYRLNRRGEFAIANNPSGKNLRRGLYFTAPETKTFEGYGDKFYNEREKAYTDYAMPQVAQQYRDAKAATMYGLANRGQLGSSLDREAGSQLERTSASARSAVVDNAIDQSSQLRRDIEAARQSAIQQLYQATDPSKAVASAIATSGQFRRPSSFAPVINAFANIANTYATNQAIQGYRRQASAYDQQSQSDQPQNFVAPIN